MSKVDWYSNYLANKGAAPQPLPSIDPTQQPMTQVRVNPLQTSPERLVNAPTKAPLKCPECSSPNYMEHTQLGQPTWRCFDCGYPVNQSGSRFGALTGAVVEGNTKASRGNDATNNFHPEQIIGRV